MVVAVEPEDLLLAVGASPTGIRRTGNALDFASVTMEAGNQAGYVALELQLG